MLQKNQQTTSSFNKQSDEIYWIIEHDELCWAPGKKKEETKTDYIVQCLLDGEHYQIDKPTSMAVHPSCLNGVGDLLQLGEFNEGALLHTIRQRYSQQQIFTQIGSPILISVNPYQRLNIFTTTVAQRYRDYSIASRQQSGQNVTKPEPHLFMVAEESYQDLLIDRVNQSVIITGESGAGKTEATKLILSYLAQASKGFHGPEEDLLRPKKQSSQIKISDQQSSIDKQVLDSNPLLEAFGNAKTFKNNNSSRFGKFIQVNFDAQGKIHSANISNYLLEKTRVCNQTGIERNFHIFYQVLANSQHYLIKQYGLKPLREYHYVNQSEVGELPDDRADFEVMLQCMRTINFSHSEITEVFDTVVALLNLGNVKFQENDNGGVSPTFQSKEFFLKCAQLLKCDLKSLTRALTLKVQVIGNEKIEQTLTLAQTIQAKDTLAKHLYGSVFNWIVQKVNVAINRSSGTTKSQKLSFIGLLDIFGFEIFKTNSFEQLCINYANEKLQQVFNQQMFQMEQEEYVKENIAWQNIKFQDNQHTIDLIDNIKNTSIFKQLDEQFMLQAAGNDGNLLKNFNLMLSTNKSYKRTQTLGSQQFFIIHYAGEVCYDVDGFVEKNKDSISSLITETLSSSTNNIIKTIYQQLRLDTSQQQSNQLKGNSISNQFRNQLNSLIQVLKKSAPRYVRCIKPNSDFSPTVFDSWDVCKQLRCAGMLEAIRIRKAGFSIRIEFEQLYKRYKPILKAFTKIKTKDAKEAAHVILSTVNKQQPDLKDTWQVGFTKAFMKEETRQCLERMLGEAVIVQVIKIQSSFRRKKAQLLAKKLRSAVQSLCKNILSWHLKIKFRKVVNLVKARMINAIKRIQRIYRSKRRHSKIIQEINKRILIKLSRVKVSVNQVVTKNNYEDLQLDPLENTNLKTHQDQTSSSRNKNPQLKQAQETIISQQREIERLAQELKEVQKENKRLINEQEQFESTCARYEETIKELEQRLDESRKVSAQSRRTNQSIGQSSNQQRASSDSMSEFGMLKFMMTQGTEFENGDYLQELQQQPDQGLRDEVNRLTCERNLLKTQLGVLQEENITLSQKSKKWIARLDEEIEKNQQNVTQLSIQIKHLQEANYNLQFDKQHPLITENDLETLEKQLEDKQRIIDALELKAFASEDLLSQTKLSYDQLNKNLHKQNANLEQFKEQVVRKDEQVLGLQVEVEELHQELEKTIQQLQQQKKINGEMQVQLQKASTSPAASMMLELKQVKEQKNWLQDQYDGFQIKLKEVIKENDELLEKNVELKKMKAVAQSQLAETNEDQQKFKQFLTQIEALTTKLAEAKKQIKALDSENNFYHQSTTLFLTIKKVMATENQLWQKFANSSNPEKREATQANIQTCTENVNQLEQRLKKLLKEKK